MSPARKELFRHGRRGSLVRVVEGVHRGSLVYWTLWPKGKGKRGEALFPRTKVGRADAIAFAEGIVEEQEKPKTTAIQGLTVEEMFRRFCEENDLHLRPNSQRLYRENWGHFVRFVGEQTLAVHCTRDSLVKLRSYLELHRKPRTLATNTVRRVMVTVRRVFRWAEDANLIPASTVLRYVYRVAKDRQPEPVPEYRLEEFVAIIGACSLNGRRWRAGAVLRLCGYQGIRQHAILHLRWEDVRWEADEIEWVSRWDKQGKRWLQPMRKPAKAVLALLHERAGSPATGWVFPSAKLGRKGKVYTAQSLWAALQTAEEEAGVEHRTRRGAHGLRRLLAGEVAKLTGNLKTAMDAIGDSDIAMAQHYVVRRLDEVRAAFDRLDAPTPETPYQPRTGETLGETERVSDIAGQRLTTVSQSAPRRNRTYNLTLLASGQKGSNRGES